MTVNVVTLDRVHEDARECRYLLGEQYRLLVILLVAKVDGWILANDAAQELERLLAMAVPNVTTHVEER